MFLAGKFAQPAVHDKESILQSFSAPSSAPRVVIHAPPGYLSAASLAAFLQQAQGSLLWFRAALSDADPATFLLALIHVFRKLDPGLGSDSLARIQHLQWLEQRWPDLYAGLADEIRRAGLGPATLVLEHVDVLQGNPSAQISFYYHFLPGLPENFRVVLTAESRPLARWLPQSTEYIAMHQLALDLDDCQKLFDMAGLQMKENTLDRLLRLTSGRHQLVAQICAFGKIFGRAYLEQNVSRSRSLYALQLRLCQDAALAFPVADLPALTLLGYLGYNHAAIQRAVIGLDRDMPVFPAVQRLVGGWQLLPDAWRVALRRTSAVRSVDQHLGLIRAGEYLCAHRAVLAGLELLVMIGAHDQASRALEQNLDQLLNLGQWQNFSDLISRLGRSSLQEYPRLLGAQGVILASRGEGQAATRYLFQSYRSALEKQEFDQACESLLALAALTEWQQEPERAFQYVMHARKLAEAAGLDKQQAWAEYHLGGLLIQEERYPAAEVYYQHAHQLADRAADLRLLACLQVISPLAARQVDLLNESLQRHEEFRAVLAAERAHADQLQRALSSTESTQLLLEGDFQNLPFPQLLKLAIQVERTNQREVPRWRRAWQRLVEYIRSHLQEKLIFRPGKPSEAYQEDFVVTSPSASRDLNMLLDKPADSHIEELLEVTHPAHGLQADPPLVQVDRQRQMPVLARSDSPVRIPVTGESPKRQAVAIYFLGNFRLGVDDALLEMVPGGQVGALLKYLVYHRQRRIPREELSELFWPDTDPELARNSLNVALSHVRQVLRSRVTADVIIYAEGKYTLTSELDYWVDLDEFEQNLEAAWNHTQADEHEQAIRCLEIAANLYQGDFLADDPYEEWTLFPRERLRLAYLDALHQLSHHYFELKRYAACAAICQSILERDNCREDVHCLLMRCYARQDQFHLGLRQYQVCVDALQRELEIEPAEATQSLYRRLKRREHTRPGVA